LKDRILKRQKEVTFLTVLTRKVRVEGEENSNIFSTVVSSQRENLTSCLWLYKELLMRGHNNKESVHKECQKPIDPFIILREFKRQTCPSVTYKIFNQNSFTSP